MNFDLAGGNKALANRYLLNVVSGKWKMPVGNTYNARTKAFHFCRNAVDAGQMKYNTLLNTLEKIF